MNVTKAPAQPGDDPNTIRAYDAYGREIIIAKAQWRAEVLPGALQAAWSDADQLARVIVGAIDDGFVADVLDAAEHLRAVDPDAVRATCVLAVALMKSGQLDRAEQHLQSFIDSDGGDGIVLTNLAKVFAEQKHADKAERTLARALEVDPNQDNALLWYVALQRDRGGSAAVQQALERIAALPASWLAELWLAGLALDGDAIDEALAYYDEALAKAGEDAPTHLLAQMSGDLGKAGRFADVLRLAAPRFVPERHGLEVGNNLVKVHVALGQHDDAAGIVAALFAMKRPEWNDTLGHWEREIRSARTATTPATVGASTASGTSPSRTALAIEAPLWLPSTSPASLLFHKPANDGPTVDFLGSTVEMGARLVRAGAAGPGRLSRALPAFLAEQIDMASGAACRTIVPWRTTAPTGFALMPTPWTDDDALRISTGCDYAVVTHLTAIARQWSVRARVLRRRDASRIGEATVLFDEVGHDLAMFSLGRQVVDMLERDGVATGSPPSGYVLPAPLSEYFIRLEQLLALRCATMRDDGDGFLSGEREILAGALGLCLGSPESVPARLLLAETVATLRAIRPEIVDEFADRIAALQKNHPMVDAAHAAVEQVLAQAAAVAMPSPDATVH